MRIAELHTDHGYRSLHLLGIVQGKPDNGVEWIDHERLDGDAPIGAQWVAPDVDYLADPLGVDPDCCEAEPGTERELESAKPHGDFPHFWGINFGVLNRRSLDALGDLIQPYVEFLPLNGIDGDYFAFKVLRCVSALDLENSAIEWDPQLARDKDKPKVARSIKRHAWNLDALQGEVIFRIPEMPFPFSVFVTDRFLDCVEANHLTGFEFREVWPPQNPARDYQRHLEKQNKKRRKDRP